MEIFPLQYSSSYESGTIISLPVLIFLVSSTPKPLTSTSVLSYFLLFSFGHIEVPVRHAAVQRVPSPSSFIINSELCVPA